MKLNKFVTLVALLFLPFISACTQQQSTNPTLTNTPGSASGDNENVDFTIAVNGLAFSPNLIETTSGKTLKVKITNNAGAHTFTLNEFGVNQRLVNGDQIITIEVPANTKAGDYEFHCTMPGHASAGMTGTLRVN